MGCSPHIGQEDPYKDVEDRILLWLVCIPSSLPLSYLMQWLLFKLIEEDLNVGRRVYEASFGLRLSSSMVGFALPNCFEFWP